MAESEKNTNDTGNPYVAPVEVSDNSRTSYAFGCFQQFLLALTILVAIPLGLHGNEVLTDP